MIEIKVIKDVCNKIIYNTDLIAILNMELHESEVFQIYLKQFRNFIFENWDNKSAMDDKTQYMFMWHMFKQQVLGIENNEY